MCVWLRPAYQAQALGTGVCVCVRERERERERVIENSLPGTSIQWAVGISRYFPLPLTQQSVEWSILLSDHALPVLVPNMGRKNHIRILHLFIARS